MTDHINPPQQQSSRWRQPAVHCIHQRSTLLNIFLRSLPLPFSFSSLLSVIHPSLQSRGSTVTRPGHNSCLASLKDQDNSQQQLINLQGKELSLLHHASSSVMLFGRLLEVSEKNITQRRNKESIAVIYRGFRGAYQWIFDSPAICWIPLKAPRLPEEVAC